VWPGLGGTSLVWCSRFDGSRLCRSHEVDMVHDGEGAVVTWSTTLVINWAQGDVN
jgi:hypothetical protein